MINSPLIKPPPRFWTYCEGRIRDYALPLDAEISEVCILFTPLPDSLKNFGQTEIKRAIIDLITHAVICRIWHIQRVVLVYQQNQPAV